MKKVILITGASSGIGKSSAKQLIKDGHIVYGAARRIGNMKDLEEMGGHAVSLDVTDQQSIDECVQTVLDREGKIDVLFNNAGYAIYGAVEDIDLAEARRQFEVNVFGLAAITKAVLPSMRAQKKGTIINTSSMGGKMYTPLGSWYHATKHALEGWSDSLRLELAPFNIDVVILEPGIILTEFGDVMSKPMIERAKGGAYEELTNQLAKSTVEMYEKQSGSSPQVIADVVSKIVRSKNPKTRYRKGKYAKPMVWIRTFLGDRIFDKTIMSQV